MEVTMTENRWLSVNEIADYLGIRSDTVYKWIPRKNMPAHKIGRLWKFRKEEVDQWIWRGEAKASEYRIKKIAYWI